MFSKIVDGTFLSFHKRNWRSRIGTNSQQLIMVWVVCFSSIDRRKFFFYFHSTFSTIRTQPTGNVWDFENEWDKAMCDCCGDLGTCSIWEENENRSNIVEFFSFQVVTRFGVFRVSCRNFIPELTNVFAHGVCQEVKFFHESKRKESHCQWLSFRSHCLANTGLRTKIRTGFRIRVCQQNEKQIDSISTFANFRISREAFAPTHVPCVFVRVVRPFKCTMNFSFKVFDLVSKCFVSTNRSLSFCSFATFFFSLFVEHRNSEINQYQTLPYETFDYFMHQRFFLVDQNDDNRKKKRHTQK